MHAKIITLAHLATSFNPYSDWLYMPELGLNLVDVLEDVLFVYALFELTHLPS